MLSSLLTQYTEMKKEHPDAVLFFRVGDFYETFSDDAIEASRILGITLTRRANGKAKSVELAGFPHHAFDSYLPKLVRAGKRVAICEHLEDPKIVKKTVKRGITELITPILKPGQTRLPNGLIIGEKEELIAKGWDDLDGRFIINKDRVGIFIEDKNDDWFFAPLILSPEDEARYKLYTQLSWKFTDWEWIDEYEEEKLPTHYEELKALYNEFVSRYGFLNTPENASFIKLDAYNELEYLEREVIDSNGNKTYVPGEGFDEIKERVDEILKDMNPIDLTLLFSLLSLFSEAMGQLYIFGEIRRKTEEIRALSRELRLSPKLAFNACYDEITKPKQLSIF